MLQKNLDLLHGPVFPALTRLALPIMGTSFVQMAYNMTDMLWIGRLGSDAVAAVGASGMYMWLAGGVAVMPRMGGQVKTGHAMGADRPGKPPSMPARLFRWESWPDFSTESSPCFFPDR